MTTGSDEALIQLSLEEVEEASAELHRRIGVALRTLGERRADDPDPGAPRHTPGGGSPRALVASHVAAMEVAALTLAEVAATAEGPSGARARLDRHVALVAAIVYAAPTVQGLLQRLEQDRRLLGSLARGLDSRLDEQHPTPWGERALRALVVEVAITEAARCAMELERRVASINATTV